MEQSFFDQLFFSLVRGKQRVIRLFHVLFIIMAFFIAIGSWSLYRDGPFVGEFARFGITAGRIALLLFIVALLPGMMGRFGVRNKFLSVLMIFRRHIGISTYLFVFTHVTFLKIVPQLAVWGKSPLLFATFELFGIAAHVILFFLFITSNDTSVKFLGVWWYRLHRLIYVAAWLIFFHVALQRVSIWTILIGIAAFVEGVSLLYHRVQGKTLE